MGRTSNPKGKRKSGTASKAKLTKNSQKFTNKSEASVSKPLPVHKSIRQQKNKLVDDQADKPLVAPKGETQRNKSIGINNNATIAQNKIDQPKGRSMQKMGNPPYTVNVTNAGNEPTSYERLYNKVVENRKGKTQDEPDVIHLGNSSLQ